MTKLALSIRATLALGLIVSASSAMAQTTPFTEINLAMPNVVSEALDAVSNNGIIVGQFRSVGGQFTSPQGTLSFFSTGVNGSSPATLSTATDFSSNGLNGGNTPFGPAYYLNSPPQIAGVNNSGTILGVGTTNQADSTVISSNGTVVRNIPGTYLSDVGSVAVQYSALSNSGALAGISNTLTGYGLYYSPIVTQSVAYLPAGAATPTLVALASGTSVYQLAGINSNDQIAGTMYDNITGVAQAFITGQNATGLTSLGTGGGSGGTIAYAVNDAGQVGGAVETSTLVTTPYGDYMTNVGTAFISTPTNQIVGIGAGAPGDDTATLFLNSVGNAVIADSTTGAYYLYDAGSVYSFDSIGLTGTHFGSVIGLTDANGIVISDPAIFDMNPSLLTGGTADTTTSAYLTVASTQGAPPPSFFASKDAGLLSSAGSSSSVPAPAGFGLLGLGLLGAFVRRRSTKALSIAA